MSADAKKTTVPIYAGRSSDYRTNRWRVVCPNCGREFNPQTTLMSKQGLTCPFPKCAAEMHADYNNGVVKLI
jgi:phage terminase large subunit GpA-like protein